MMNENNMYRLKLLKETAVSEDLFEDKTHERIANTLFDVIQNGSDEGITIGLEGGWGSGKSTVVSILKKKLEAVQNIRYFYFDAWSHEGDPLRRVFLESMVEQIGQNNGELKKIKERVSNRIKTRKIKTRQTVTALGKWLSVAAFLMPLGAAIISATASEITVQWGGNTNWMFWIGVVFVLAPIWVLLANCIKLFKQGKSIKDPNNWIFLQGETKSTVTQEVSEDEERSSIEFEMYFNEIVEAIFSDNGSAKLLIVVDNLDRVDAADSLKVWSTLQTFLQRKNPTNNKCSWHEKIWVLVPYDEEGLAKLWDNKLGEASVEADDSCAKSFFDKCFQLRIEVPKPILSGWEQFCMENIKQALIDWEESELKEVVDVLKWTRKDVSDIPTPREIKTYINQVGLLRQHCDSSIPTKSIAYFVVNKYLEFQKNSDIEDKLVSGRLPEKRHQPLFAIDTRADLCGILFGVAPEKGQQILLEPKIEQALNSKDAETIKDLCEIHSSAFWAVFYLHLSSHASADKTFRYSYTVSNVLAKDYPDNCQEFTAFLKTSCDTLESLDFPTTQNIDEYVTAFSMLEAGKYNFSKIWRLIIHSLQKSMVNDDFDFDTGSEALGDLANCQKRNLPEVSSLNEVPVERWMKWSTACKNNGFDGFQIVKPSKSLVNEVAEAISANAPVPADLYNLINYLRQCGEKQWAPVIKATEAHINTNQGTPQNGVPSEEIFPILYLLSTIDHDIKKSIIPIVKSGQFYNLAFNYKNNGAIKHAAFLMARCVPDEFASLNTPNLPQNPAQQNSQTGLTESRQFWQISNEENANFVWDKMKNSSDLEFIWSLSESGANKLIGVIIKIAVNEDYSIFFNCKNALQRLKNSLVLTEDESSSFKDKLVKCFISQSSIEQEIVDSEDLNILDFSEELYLVVNNSTNDKVVGYIIEILSMVTKEEWHDSLVNDTYLTSLSLAIKEKIPSFSLDNNYYESLDMFLKSCMTGDKTLEDWQKNHLSELITVLGSSFQIHLRNNLTSYLIEIGFKGNVDAIESLLDYLDLKKVVTSGKEKLQEAVGDFINEPNLDALRMINTILSHSGGKKFTPDTHLSEVFKAPLTSLVSEQEDSEDIVMLRELASRFSINLEELLVGKNGLGQDNDNPE